jgi:PAS domain S-box-containing protein
MAWKTDWRPTIRPSASWTHHCVVPAEAMSAAQPLSIRARLLLLVLAVLSPMVGLAAWLLAAQVGAARAAAETQVRILADGTAADVDHMLVHAQALLKRLTAEPAIRTLDAVGCNAMRVESIRLDGEFSALWLRDRNGLLVCSSLSDPAPLLDPKDRPWFDEAIKAGGFVASSVLTRPHAGRWSVLLSQPVRDGSGLSVGLLTVSIDLLNLNRQLLASVPASTLVTVLDHERATLLRSALPESFIGQPPPRDEQDSTQGLPQGLFSALGRDGVPRLFAFRQLPTVGWRVYAGVPEAEVVAGHRATVCRAVGLGGGLLLLALALAWRLSNLIARPINSLADVAHAVALGDGSRRVQADGPAELATVGRAFNAMLDARDASEAARQEAEDRYRTIVEWSPEALFVHRHRRILYANPATVALIGAQSADPLLGRSIFDFVHPHSQPVIQDWLQRTSRPGPCDMRLKVILTRLDGSPIIVEVEDIAVIYDGEPARLTSLRDVTAHKRAELALQRSEARLRGIVDASTVAILTVDDSQTIVSANPAAAAMFRCAVEEMTNSPLERFIPARFRDRHRLDVQAYGLAGQPPRQMARLREVVGLRADGEEFPVDAGISHLLLDGELQFTVTLRDLTETRRAEAALRDGEAGLRRLLGVLPEAVFVVSGSRIGFVNEAAQRLCQADEAALLGQSLADLLQPGSAALLERHIAMLQGGAVSVPMMELTLLRSDGSLRVAEATGTRVDQQGEGSVVIVMRDATDLVEARHALADSHAELQRLVAAQDRVQEDERQRIARELHDDLQQTLAAIRINLVAIGQRLPSAPASVGPLLTETGELAATAIESTRRIINDLRPQMLEDLGLVPALEALVSQFARRTGLDCALRVAGAPDAEGPSPAVAVCLYRITQEALNNVSRHAMATVVRVRYARNADGGLLLRIVDNGRGLQPGPRKPASFGLLGMGERVRAIGATLVVHGRPGQGTAIEVRVPADAASDAALG